MKTELLNSIKAQIIATIKSSEIRQVTRKFLQKMLDNQKVITENFRDLNKQEKDKLLFDLSVYLLRI